MAEKKRNKRGELVSDLWRTPDDLFDQLNETFQFHVDAAADKDNTKCDVWFGPGGVVENALEEDDWSKYGRRFFVNPPYSTEAGPLASWVEQFKYQATTHGILIVAVLPERRNVKWYHRHVKGHAALFEPDSRVSFIPPKEEESTGPGARQGAMIPVWTGRLALSGSWT